MKVSLKSRRLAAWFLACSVMTGCGGSDGPTLAPVKGKVTLDGSPLAGAEVGFFPVKEGRPSFGKTDEKGEYSLQYTESQVGGTVGDNTVQIRRAAVSGEGIDPKTLPTELSEQYNDKTTLTGKVEPGGSVVNFELKTMDRKDGKKSSAPVARP